MSHKPNQTLDSKGYAQGKSTLKLNSSAYENINLDIWVVGTSK